MTYAIFSQTLVCSSPEWKQFTVPRPLSTNLHATKPSEVIQFDYLFLGEVEEDFKYALVVKDDLSGYCWLEPSKSAYSEYNVDVLAQCNRVFTTQSVWMSD